MKKFNQIRQNSILKKNVLIHTEVVDTIHDNCRTLDDVEGYVYNRLLWDDGDSGADFYEITSQEFKRIVLNAMAEVFTANQK